MTETQCWRKVDALPAVRLSDDNCDREASSPDSQQFATNWEKLIDVGDSCVFITAQPTKSPRHAGSCFMRERKRKQRGTSKSNQELSCSIKSETTDVSLVLFPSGDFFFFGKDGKAHCVQHNGP